MKKKNSYFMKVTVVGFYGKLIDHDDEKVRDDCHVTAKFRSTPHWSSN